MLTKIGISGFLGCSKGFHGTIKNSAQDFRVNEIDVSEHVVYLTNFDLPEPISEETKNRPQKIARLGDEPRNQCKKEASQSLIQKEAEALGKMPCSNGEWRVFLEKNIGKQKVSILESFATSTKAKFGDVCKKDNSISGNGSFKASGLEDGDLGNKVEIHSHPTDDSGLVLQAPTNKHERAVLHEAIKEAFPWLQTSTKRISQDGHTEEDNFQIFVEPVRSFDGLRMLLDVDEVEKILHFYHRGPQHACANAGCTLSVNKDKNNRTKIHHAIAQISKNLITKTAGDGEDKFVVVHWARLKGKAKRKKGQQSSERSKNFYLQFVLKKTDREHLDTVLELMKVIHAPPSLLTTAGIKDKRAITQQLAVINGIHPKRLLGTNGKIRGVEVGNLKYCSGPLNPGDLKGNKFQVTIRDITEAHSCTISAAVAEVQKTGFINFFGTQRVGHPDAEVKTYEIGLCLLKQEFRQAVELILKGSAKDSPEVKEALQCYKDGNISKAFKRMPQSMSSQRLVLQGLNRYGPEEYKKAVLCVPYQMRTLWVHAYQGILWNRMASLRLKSGMNAISGDLFLQSDVVSADDSVAVLKDEMMGVNTESGISNEQIFQQVVLPLIGHGIQLPGGKIGDAYKTLLSEDGISIEMLSTLRKEHKDAYIPKGSYRKLLSQPREMECKIFGKGDEVAVMQASNIPSIRTFKMEGCSSCGNNGPLNQCKEISHVQVSFILQPGCFATMCIREMMKLLSDNSTLSRTISEMS